MRLETELDLSAAAKPAASPRRVASSSLLLTLVVFALLWVVLAPYRRIYLPRVDDITALADGLLLLPGAHWQDWFTSGHSHFFDAYPEWPWGLSPFARPAFQSLIHLAHLVFEKPWQRIFEIDAREPLLQASAAPQEFIVEVVASGQQQPASRAVVKLA